MSTSTNRLLPTKVTTTNMRENRMARPLEGNIRKSNGGRSVTSRRTCRGNRSMGRLFVASLKVIYWRCLNCRMLLGKFNLYTLITIGLYRTFLTLYSRFVYLQTLQSICFWYGLYKNSVSLFGEQVDACHIRWKLLHRKWMLSKCDVFLSTVKAVSSTFETAACYQAALAISLHPSNLSVFSCLSWRLYNALFINHTILHSIFLLILKHTT
jgi:hypothetical protein